MNFVREYYLLTAWQLVNLRYSPGSLTYVQTLLQELSGNKESQGATAAFLRRRGLYPATFGNVTQIYYLGAPAMSLLEELGYPITARHRRTDKIQEYSFPPLIHALNVNDLLIAGRNLPRTAPDISLADWKHDFDLHTTPAQVELERNVGDGDTHHEKVALIPDGALDFRLQRAERELRRVLLLEVDRGTESNIEAFKKKIHAYIPYALPGGPFEQMFGRVNKRVVWVVTKGGQDRLRTIKRWCEEELTRQELTHENNLFRFVIVDQVSRTDGKGQVKQLEELAVDPRSFFLSPIAYKPFESEPDSLLWKAQAE